MDRATVGTVLVVLGGVVFVGALAVSAATAPTAGVDSGGEPRTLVGSQGENSWHKGGSVFLLEGNRTVWRTESADSYFDVTMREETVLAGFMHSGYQSGCAPYDPPCTKTGFRVIDPDGGSDGGPAVVDEYAYPVRSRTNSETHDVERLASGEYLVSDMEHERIFTVQNGSVTWEWRASSFYRAPDDPTRRDWLHINDVDAVNETHYLVSVRNANQLVLVERGEGVVEVVNEDDGGDDGTCRVRQRQLVPGPDGDVRCGDPAVMNHQHNPQWLGPDAVLVADSDNDRVVELHENETTGEWEPVWALRTAGGIELHWPRDADRLSNGNTLVTDTHNGRVFEVTPNGSVVRSAHVGGIPYEAERLPEGERVGGATYTASGAIARQDGGVPVITPAVDLLRGAAPWLPFWFAEAQFVAVLFALGLAGTGASFRYRS